MYMSYNTFAPMKFSRRMAKSISDNLAVYTSIYEFHWDVF